MTKKPTTTHKAPFTGKAHPGPFNACHEYPCKPRREATGILREDRRLNPAERAAADAIRDAQWTLLHADDRDFAVALLLSNAGLLRDKANEEHLARFGAANAAAVERRRLADARALREFEGLVAAAAGLLDGGTDPAQVAAQLRDLSAQISERRERSTAVIPSFVQEQEAIGA